MTEIKRGQYLVTDKGEGWFSFTTMSGKEYLNRRTGPAFDAWVNAGQPGPGSVFDLTGTSMGEATVPTTKPTKPTKTSKANSDLIDLGDYAKDIDPRLLIPALTGTILDEFFTTDGGLLASQVLAISAGPGVGKSTIVLQAGTAIVQHSGMNAAYVSTEMGRVHLMRYMSRMKGLAGSRMGTLLIPDEMRNPEFDLFGTLRQLATENDVMIIDSLSELIIMIKEINGISESMAWSQLYNLIAESRESGKFTRWILILQQTKGGVFKGDNRMMHLVDSMLDIESIGKKKGLMQFSKNRYGGGPALEYTLTNAGAVFNELKFRDDQAIERYAEQAAAADTLASRTATLESLKALVDKRQQAEKDEDTGLVLEPHNNEKVDWTKIVVPHHIVVPSLNGLQSSNEEE